jgi:prevent-host-death family protein
MRRYNLSDAKTNLSALVDAVQDGREVEITCYGEPKAKLVRIGEPAKIELGFRKIEFTTDLSAPTDQDISELFSGVQTNRTR